MHFTSFACLASFPNQTIPSPIKNNIMKNLMIILLSTLISLSTYANNIIEAPHKTVVAKSGLTLRMFAGMKSPAIKVIPFGENVTILETLEENESRVDWVKGTWVLVAHEGDTGYVFDGFLTSLDIPEYEFELNQFELDFIYPLEAYAEYRFVSSELPDTLNKNDRKKVTINFEDNSKLIKTSTDDYYKVELILSDARIMDAYHLLQNMIPNKRDLKKFNELSLFIADEKGDVERIKVQLNNPIRIDKMQNGQIKIGILTSESGCKL